MSQLESQTNGRVRAADFAPGSAENAYCSFTGKFFVGSDGRLRSSTPPATSSICCNGPTVTQATATSSCGCGLPAPDADASRARRFVAAHWVAPAERTAGDLPGVDVSSFDAFLAERQHSFCISGMAFQDAWTLDLERLRECFIHVVSPDRRVVPFCTYNLTAMSGESLYRQPVCANV